MADVDAVAEVAGASIKAELKLLDDKFGILMTKLQLIVADASNSV